MRNAYNHIALHFTMIRLLKQLAIYFTVALVISMTGGIAFIQTNCSCEESSQLIAIEESADCSADSGHECCNTPIPEKKESVCCTDEEESGKHQCPVDNKCCSTIYTYVKTDQFNIIDSNKKTIGFIIAYTTVVSEPYRQQEIVTNHFYQHKDKLPPPKYGTELLCEIHQLKIDPLFA